MSPSHPQSIHDPNNVFCEGDPCPNPEQVSYEGFVFPRDPFLIKPPNAELVDIWNSANIAAGAETELWEITIGPSQWLVFKEFGQEIADNPAGAAITGFANSIWKLRLNDSGFERYGNIVDQIGRGDNGRITDLRFFAPGSRVTLSVENTHGVDSFLFFGMVKGWTIPYKQRF